MTLNRARNYRRLCIVVAGLAFALMIFSKAFVLVVTCPSPTTGYFGVRVSDNLICLFRVPGGLPTDSLPRTQIQRSRGYYDPVNSPERAKLDLYSRIVIPLWVPLVLAGLPIVFLSWRIRIKAKVNKCAECNYNLHRNASGRCPECGTEIEAPSD